MSCAAPDLVPVYEYEQHYILAGPSGPALINMVNNSGTRENVMPIFRAFDEAERVARYMGDPTIRPALVGSGRCPAMQELMRAIPRIGIAGFCSVRCWGDDGAPAWDSLVPCGADGAPLSPGCHPRRSIRRPSNQAGAVQRVRRRKRS
jgi:hypothetical protein